MGKKRWLVQGTGKATWCLNLWQMALTLNRRRRSGLLAGLNPAQREAVLTLEGPSCSGRGRQAARPGLTYRIAQLVASGVRPSRILAVTFTNKAAAEMRQRVGDLVKGAEGSWISTFHSTCVRILRSHGERIGLPNNYVIYDSSDQLTTMRRALRELNLDPKKFVPQRVLGKISRAKNELVEPGDYIGENSGDLLARTEAQIYATYQKILRQNGALDFDDLLVGSCAPAS